MRNAYPIHMGNHITLPQASSKHRIHRIGFVDFDAQRMVRQGQTKMPGRNCHGVLRCLERERHSRARGKTGSQRQGS